MELTEEQIAALRATFDKFDINHDGTILSTQAISTHRLDIYTFRFFRLIAL